MTTETIDTTAEAEVRASVASWLDAVKAADVDRIVSHYAPDILAFDAVQKLQFKGVDAYKTHWQACLAMCPGPMTFQLGELDVAAAGDIAFAHCLSRCGATDEHGNEKASWMRMTACYRKIGGRWLVVHEHFSAPFEIESGRALLDLEP